MQWRLFGAGCGELALPVVAAFWAHVRAAAHHRCHSRKGDSPDALARARARGRQAAARARVRATMRLFLCL